MRSSLTLLSLLALTTGCELTPTSSTLNFGTIYVGETTTQQTRWTNVSNSAIRVRGFQTMGSAYRVTNPATFTETSIPKNGQTVSVTITFAPRTDGTHTGDTVPVVHFPRAATGVQLTGAAVYQKLTGNGFGVTGGNYVVDQPLDFGTVTPGTVVTRQFRLFNTSNAAIAVNGSLLVGGQGFSITTPAGGNVNIPAGSIANPQRVTVTITFTAPQNEGQYLDVAEFKNNSGYKFGITVKGRVTKPSGN